MKKIKNHIKRKVYQEKARERESIFRNLAGWLKIFSYGPFPFSLSLSLSFS
jgi:hypothetical protein